MATVACPGCGLPRAETEVGATPCPVCDAAPASFAATASRKKQPDPDPTAGLPADVSQLNAARPQVPGEANSRVLVGAVTFALGAFCGVGGVLGFQAIDWPKPQDAPEVVANPEAESTLGRSAPTLPAVAPMPHEPAPKPIVRTPPDADFHLVQQPPPPGQETVVKLNQPDATYAVPFPMKSGEHVVLQGKVKTLRVAALDAGAILDASKLEASVIIVTGDINNRSTLKLNAPNGVIRLTRKIDGNSLVELKAPGGEVKFMLSTTPSREGSKIDGGSTVSVTARQVEFKGDITGTGTKVAITLTSEAVLRVATVNGKAIVEYRSPDARRLPPEVVVGSVARTATFRKID
jgi:hypothetical protein